MMRSILLSVEVKTTSYTRLTDDLKENQLQTTPETPGVSELMRKQQTTDIPIFKEEVGAFAMDGRPN